jgi:hypothetical protein
METGATGAGWVSAFSSGVAAINASHSRRVMEVLLFRMSAMSALSEMISQMAERRYGFFGSKRSAAELMQ